MPVDLSLAGLPSSFPSSRPRLMHWGIAWLLSTAIGGGLVILFWPAAMSTHGPWFWCCVIGGPNALFFIALGLRLTHVEVRYLQALYRNHHRRTWLEERIEYAQQPLKVIATGYCLPLASVTLTAALSAGTSLTGPKIPRNGAGYVEHNRFAEDDPVLSNKWNCEPWFADAARESAGSSIPSPDTLAPQVSIIRQALSTVVPRLQLLCNGEIKYMPAVRVIASTEQAAARVHHVREALRCFGFADLECLAAPASAPLMLLDSWLDAGEERALLVVCAEWYADVPPDRSTESAIAVLFAPMHSQLPASVCALGQIHRPVQGDYRELGDVLANTSLWGSVDPSDVAYAWIGNWSSDDDTVLFSAFQNASLSGLESCDTQRRIDPVIGKAGASDGWLSMIAALESGIDGVHLIVDGAATVKAAILNVSVKSIDHHVDD